MKEFGSLCEIQDNMEQELWLRFIYNIDEKSVGILDFSDLSGKISLPTPHECENNFPNALAWWTPVENGSFFGGLYLYILCEKYKKQNGNQKILTARRAKLIANGLYKFASVGAGVGFIARGIANDGHSHYSCGSDDQTAPWFLGLYSYILSDIPESAEKTELGMKIIEVAFALKQRNFSLPCSNGFYNDGKSERGNLCENGFRSSCDLLFICKIMAEFTKCQEWQNEYQKRLLEKPYGSEKTRLEILTIGMIYDFSRTVHLNYELWIFACAQTCLFELCRLDRENKRLFEKGLNLGCYSATGIISRHLEYDNKNDLEYDTDWRKLGELYKDQKNPNEAVEVAFSELNYFSPKLMPRRHIEIRHMREPFYAAYIATLSTDKKFKQAISPICSSLLFHFDYTRLYTSHFYIGLGIGMH